MAYSHVLLGAGEAPAALVIHRIGFADLKDALRRGLDDFHAMPTHAMFLCAIYPIVGLLAARGLYELSRRREAGLAASASHVLDAVDSTSIGAIVALGLLLLGLFVLWIAVANAIYIANFGYAPPASLGSFIHDVLTTKAGWTLIVVGNGVGFLFAATVLIASAVSFPLLLDRDVGAAVALSTSIRVVQKNPVTMAAWGLIVAALLLAGSLPA